MSTSQSRKRALPSTLPWERHSKDHRRDRDQGSPRGKGPYRDSTYGAEASGYEENHVREQYRLNHVQEAEQMREWVAKEDEFVLSQSKKKARIRVREGRARPIDWLAVTLSVVDNTKDPLEDEDDEMDMDVIDPAGVFEGLDNRQLQELGRDIESYLSLETNHGNRKYWNALKVISRDHQLRSAPTLVHGRNNTSVLADIDRLLSPKTLPQLAALEDQVSNKLQSNEPIDVEYWEHLLRSVAVCKAKAELSAVYKSIIERRLGSLKEEQRSEANNLARKLELLLEDPDYSDMGDVKQLDCHTTDLAEHIPNISYSRQFDPEPLLKVRAEGKKFEIVEEKDFMDKLVRCVSY